MTSFNDICNTVATWLEAAEPQNPGWPPESWEMFQLVCRVHGIGPLLHKKLKKANWLAPDTQSWLNEQYDFNARRIAKMQAELKAILATFAQNNIPLMPLKGSILSTAVYPDPGRRPMADLDLLIHPNDFQTATQLLISLGYQPDVAHWKHTEFCQPDNRQVVSKTVEHPDNPRKLEIHLKCRESFGGPTVDITNLMWANATKREMLGERATLPNTEALWLHLLLHATYHMWQGRGRLIHLLDLTLLTPHLVDPLPYLNAIDARFSYLALAMQHKYFPASLDETLLIEQRQRISPTFLRWVDALDLVNSSYLNPAPQGTYLSKAIKFSEGRPREVAQALRFALLPGLEEIALDHPRLARSKVPWLAYFLLPLDWAKRMFVTRTSS